MFYSEKLADFIVNSKQIPLESSKRAKELMIDALGVALAGRNEACVNNAINALKSLPNSGGNCKIWGKEERLSSINAAMINGIAAHALDFDDTHTEAILHGSAILAPLCLSYGFSVCDDGEKILRAFVIGWEVAARVGVASNGSFHKRGFHTTAIAGIFGSVAASAVLHDLNLQQTIYALGLAGSFASGVNEFLSNGSNSKVLHIANAIKNGILVANFAKSGMSGPLSIFEGRDNVFKTFGIEEECDKEALVRGLGIDYQVLQVSLKPYPCCHFAHGLIECALELRKDGLKSEDIQSICCFVDSVPISFICDPINSKYTPKTDYEAKFSMPFLMSSIFHDGMLNLESYRDLNRAEVLEFARKITYKQRKSDGFPKYFPGHLEAVLKDGRVIQKDVFINKGNFDNPLSFEELKAKFLGNANIEMELASNLMERINGLENLSELEV